MPDTRPDPLTKARGRFDALVSSTDAGCWEWTGNRSAKGYGRFTFGGRNVQASRWLWEYLNGPIPAGLFVCHTCDNPPCVRIDHLFLGTAEMLAQGRDVAPERMAWDTLSEQDRLLDDGIADRLAALRSTPAAPKEDDRG